MSGAEDTAHPDNAMLVRKEVIFSKKVIFLKTYFALG